MADWRLSWLFDRQQYFPDSRFSANLWLENTGYGSIYASEVRVQFDWQGDYCYSKECGITLSPMVKQPLTAINSQLPGNVVGNRSFRFGVRTWEQQPYMGWSDRGVLWTDWTNDFEIKASPEYTCFLSRSLHEIDNPTVTPFESTILGWGLNPITVGKNVFALPEEQIKEAVKRYIQASDCLIGVATRRFLAQINGFAWKPFEWLSYEVSVADGLGKPVLIIREKDLVIPRFLSDFPSISFDSNNLKESIQKVSDYMPALKSQISSKKSQDFWGKAAKIGAGTALCILLGIGIGRNMR